MDNHDCLIIAEIGCTHVGKMDRAKKLIDLAATSKANYIKFQKRCPRESTPKRWWNKPHPNQKFAYGQTYLEHRENLELNITQHAELKKYCESKNIGYSTSVWDLTSAKEVIRELNPDFIKIPSACNENYVLLDYIYNNYDKKVHISLGMTDINSRNKIYQYLQSKKEQTVIYHCTSKYPCDFEYLYLLEINKLKNLFPIVGFSNHGYGIAADIAAYMLGAKYIERHFIDDRSFPHTDAKASLSPIGLTKVVRDIKAIKKSLDYKPNHMDQEEQEQANKLKMKLTKKYNQLNLFSLL